jgi:hypothetical protein
MPDIVKDPQPNKSGEPTPDQLLIMLDLQIAAKRAQRQKSPRRRLLVISLGLLFIVIGTMAALLLLHIFASDLPSGPRLDRPTSPLENSH